MNFSNNKFPNRPLELLSIQERDELSAPDNVDPAQEVDTDDLVPILDISASISNRAKRIRAGQLVEKISGGVFATTSLSNLSDREQAIENLGPFDTAMVTVEGESQAFSLAHQLSRVTDGADRTLSNLTDNEQALENIGALDRTKNLSDILNASTALSNLGGMAGSNNLSEIVDAATARANLGLGTAATANASAFATAAQGALAETAAQPADLTAVENFASGYTDTAIDDLNLGTASQSNVEDFDPAGSASSAITTANNYTDSEIAGLNLGTAAQASADDFDPAGSAASVQTNLNSLENSLGTAAFANTSQFATAAQGELADTALQPGDVPANQLFDTLSDVENTNISQDVNTIYVSGHSTVGIGGGVYIRVASQPSHAGRVQSNDGTWWELNEQLPNVLMFGGESGSNSQAAIIGLIGYAMEKNVDVSWPDGTYISTNNIPNLHAVNHHGPGRISRGSDVFTLSPKAVDENTLYVAETSGTDNNDGLSASEPMRSVHRAFEVLSQYGPELNGTWTIQLAAGDYAGGAEFPINITQSNYVYLSGPDVGGHPNVPTAVIDHSLDTNQVFGILINYSGRLFITDLLVNGAFEYGLSISRHADVPVSNLHLENIITDEVHEF